MTKAREFWVYQNGLYPSFEATQIYKQAPLVAVTPIHVREVINIDWGKFWEKFKGGSINREISRDCKEVIEGLVVRAINNEL